MQSRDWLLIGAAAAGVWWLMTRGQAVAEAAAGAVTGDNALTRGATDASGDAVDAYVGAGIVGTDAAAINAASGGYLATAGEWLGETFSEWFDPATRAANDSMRR